MEDLKKELYKLQGATEFKDMFSNYVQTKIVVQGNDEYLNSMFDTFKQIILSQLNGIDYSKKIQELEDKIVQEGIKVNTIISMN